MSKKDKNTKQTVSKNKVIVNEDTIIITEAKSVSFKLTLDNNFADWDDKMTLEGVVSSTN